MPKVHQTVKNTGGGGGGASVLDQDYSAAWGADAVAGRTARVIYNQFQLIGYVPGNIADVNFTGGNDSTAVLGNSLRPFKTIGAAQTAIGTLTNSLIRIASNSYTITDADCPFGLKTPGSYYDIYCAPGVTINSYCTYGMYISGPTTRGNVFGYGVFNNYSSTATGTVDGVSGYTMNISGAAAPYQLKNFEFSTIRNNAAIHAIRIGNCTTFNSNVSFSGRGDNYVLNVNSGNKDTLFLDTNSKFRATNINGYFANALSGIGLVLKLNNPNGVIFENCDFYSHGTQFGANMSTLAEIRQESGDVVFRRCTFYFAGSTVGYKVIYINNTVSAYNNLLFDSCKIKSRTNTIYASGGNSIVPANPISLKGIDTYLEKDLSGSALTNLISSGNGFMVEPNL